MSREPGPVKGGKTVIAFVDDPTGYKFELSERPLFLLFLYFLAIWPCPLAGLPGAGRKGAAKGWVEAS